MRRAWPVFVALLLALPWPAVGQETVADWDSLRSVYDYDASQPLDAEVGSVEESALFVAEELSFTGAGGERVPALLIRPANVERAPCVLFLHGLGGNKEHARAVATLLVPQGMAVIAIDAPLHGERAPESLEPGEMAARLAAANGPLVNTVIDNRRAIDYIWTREDLDGERTVLVGVSMGAMLGSIVAAVDDRVDAAALLVGGGSWDLIVRQSQHPVAQRLRETGLGDGETLARVEPVAFVGHISPRPVLMVNGTQDAIMPVAAAEALHEAAGEPKEVKWYEGGHVGIPPALLAYVTGWVTEQVAEPAAAGN